VVNFELGELDRERDCVQGVAGLPEDGANLFRAFLEGHGRVLAVIPTLSYD
jgi:hypothetical protein